jgi:hypothetical protein
LEEHTVSIFYPENISSSSCKTTHNHNPEDQSTVRCLIKHRGTNFVDIGKLRVKGTFLALLAHSELSAALEINMMLQ